ncbi:DUF4331 family protein [Mycolicibacterium palauense]|uniref:DUF4331 family protein n=1 Tax=Mycolicibacterium palauense TaxID=2034511 RepID=UPI000BFEBC80|nr:DUF4331 family protein [Mycolicibacterium palauense]
MSNHFTGLSLGPPLGDQRLDLCDLYVFESPADPTRTVLILNANPNADFMYPGAVYRLNIDNNGDLRTEIAFSFVFSEPHHGRQTYDVYLAVDDADSPQAIGSRIFERVPASFGRTPNIVTSGSFTVFAGARSDAFFFDFDGIKNLFDTSGGRNFTAPHLGGESPWTGVDSNLEANVFSMAVEMPTSALAAAPDIKVWGRCSVSRDGVYEHVDRAGHPSVSSFFNTDETKAEYNAGHPIHDRERWMGMFVHLMGHTGGYTREEAIEAIEDEGTLPDMLTYDPARPAHYPNGRALSDDVIDYRLAFLTKGECPPTGLSPHTDTLTEFPYLGPPH